MIVMLAMLCMASPALAQDDDESTCTGDLTDAITALQDAQANFDDSGDVEDLLDALDAVQAELDVVAAECSVVPPLEQTYSAEDVEVGLGLQFDYPTGWAIVEDTGFIVTGTSEATASIFSGPEVPTLDRGEYALLAFIPYAAEIIPLEFLTVEGVVEELAVSLNPEQSGYSVGELETFTIADRPAARIDVTTDVGTLLPLIAVEYDNRQIVAFFGAVNPADLEIFNATATAIIETFELVILE